MRNYIRIVNCGFSTLGLKRTSFFDSEKSSYNSQRRSPYFNSSFKKDKRISESNIVFLRPYNKKGIDNFSIKEILGKELKTKVKYQQLVEKKLFY